VVLPVEYCATYAYTLSNIYYLIYREFL